MLSRGEKTTRLQIHIGRIGRMAGISMCGISVAERQMRRVMHWFRANSLDREVCANFAAALNAQGLVKALLSAP
jgi:hypothetical protein